MTQVTDAPIALLSQDGAGATLPGRRATANGLSTMRLPELQKVGQQLGIPAVRGLRKGDLLAAIEAVQNGGAPAPRQPAARAKRGAAPATNNTAVTTDERPAPAADHGAPANGSPSANGSAPANDGPAANGTAPAASEARSSAPSTPAPAVESPAALLAAVVPGSPNGHESNGHEPNGHRSDGDRADGHRSDRDEANGSSVNGDRPVEIQTAPNDAPPEDAQALRGRVERGLEARSRQNGRNNGRQDTRPQETRPQENRPDTRQNDNRHNEPRQNDNRQNDNRQNENRQNDNRQNEPRTAAPDDGGRWQDDDEPRGRRRRRGRDRMRERGGRPRTDGPDQLPADNGPTGNPDPDAAVVGVAGILDVLDNYAFVRTSGYLPGPNDVYVSLSMVKRYGLRKGDAITGLAKAPGDADRREKYNPIVRLDTVNGADPEQSRNRVEFNKLTPLYPTDRLRLETEPTVMATRVVDLVAPIGKGQRGLIVSPPKAGKTIMLQALANAITTNNPECHLMVVLVDERPEEVTDMQRTVKGEVIASTFDRPAADHTTVAELAIERAKRLVELGRDVVVLLDSITRLGRAYNISAPASGRILSGGVDSSALYPPKRFFGAARNIEHGGSLTILATALVETGSKMDEVIFEEFKGTGNMELKLSRQLADRRIFPAIDVIASGTRREEILLPKEELQVMWKLRRVLSGLEQQQAIELILDRLRKTRSNYDFLLQVQKTTPASNGRDD